MSEELDPQPVVTTPDPQPKAGGEAVDARTEGSDLDTLLKTYDEQTAPTTPAATPSPEQTPGADIDPKVIAARFQQVESYVTEAHNIQFKRDMNDTVKTIRGDLDPGVFDDVLVEAYLDAQAKQDPRLAKAWLERHAKPKQFDQVKTALAKNFAKKFSQLPDRQVTEDREAVTAAVRGASTRTPEGKAPDYSKMSDSDLQKEKDKLFGT